MPALTADFDPAYAQQMKPTAQPFTDDFTGEKTGLAVVYADGLTVRSRDTEALRTFAAAILHAADLADAITAEHGAVSV